MILTHAECYPIFKSNVFDSNIRSIQKLVESTVETSINLFPDNQKEQDNFKGNVLEIFAEFVLKYKIGDLRFALADYQPVKRTEDRGVDGWGIGNDGTNFSVQVKFRNNPRHKLSYRELATYLATSLNPNAARKVTNINNLLIFTTAEDINYKLRNQFQGIKTICRAQLATLFDHNNIFWQDLQTALRESCENITPRVHFEPKKHQAEILTTLKHFLDSNDNRCQILSATGSGKTFIEKEIAEEQIRYKLEKESRPSIIVSTVPRLALLQQILTDFHDQKRLDWDFMKVGSGGIEELTKYPNDIEYESLAASTNVNDIVDKINSSITTNKSLIIFSTYHSIERVGIALNRCNLEADLVLADEAHNTVRSFRDVLMNTNVPVKKRIFFTATQRTSHSNNGFGMNNEEIYGKVLARISAAELSRQGLLCFPRLHFVEVDGETININYDRDDEQLEDALKIIISAFKFHEQNLSKEVRFIVACKSAEQAHLLAESPDLKTYLPHVYLEAITTHERMDRTKCRKDIFDRFKVEKFAILFHYDIISEGVDLPGATSVLSLRRMGDIKTVQFIGRILRLDPEDRASIENDTISLPFTNENWYSNWKKPFGYVVIPLVKGTSLIDWSAQLIDVVRALRSINYQPFELIGEDSSIGDQDDDVEFEEENFNMPNMLNSFHIQDEHIRNHIKHLIESVEETLRMNNTIDPLSVIEWESIIDEEISKFIN